MSGIYVTADSRFIEKGRLWRVVGPESQENFVLGTIHVDSKLIHDATPEFNQIFTNVRSILFEYPDSETVALEAPGILNHIMSKDVDNNLRIRLQVATEELLKKKPATIDHICDIISNYYHSVHDVDLGYLKQLKTLDFISLYHLGARVKILYMSASTAKNFDMTLFSEAKKLKELGRVDAVENIEPFVNFLQAEYNLASKLDDKNLELMLKGYAMFAWDYNYDIKFDHANDIKLYLAGTYKDHMHSILASIHAERNILMFDAIQKYFASGNALLCVGVEHCFGGRNILELLQQHGCKIERVLETPNLMHYRNEFLKVLYTALFRLELLAAALAVLNAKDYSSYNYTAILAFCVGYALAQTTSASQLFSQLPLLYLLGNVLLNPGWMRPVTLIATLPLSRPVLNAYLTFDAMSRNSGPKRLEAEFMKRSKLLYINEVPVNTRTMLTAYKAQQNNDKTTNQPEERKRQALRFINAPA